MDIADIVDVVALIVVVFFFVFVFFFFNDTATTEIYTLSLHDALPIWCRRGEALVDCEQSSTIFGRWSPATGGAESRSEEHTSELQSQSNLVCRLLLEKKKMTYHRVYSVVPIDFLPEHPPLSIITHVAF